MTKAELMKQYEEVKENVDSIVLMIHMPTGETEVITNPNVAEKIAYIDKTYDDVLIHSNCNSIYIEDVFFCLKDDTYDFGTAINFLKDGMKLARKGWNGKGMYVYMTSGSVVQFDELKPETQENLRCLLNDGGADCVEILSHIDMKAADNTITIGWTPSQADMFATDWFIVE